jgi:hypothetical protein
MKADAPISALLFYDWDSVEPGSLSGLSRQMGLVPPDALPG